ncbi:MAG: hypothetical protein AAFQ45_02105 [Pseudomonadota bacterium]
MEQDRRFLSRGQNRIQLVEARLDPLGIIRQHIAWHTVFDALDQASLLSAKLLVFALQACER